MTQEFDEETADRLLAGELDAHEVTADYRRVAALLAATRAEPSAAELARQGDTVRAMAAARRSGEAIDPAEWRGPTSLSRRRNMRLGVILAAASMSLTTGLAAAGLLPASLRSVGVGALATWGSSPDSSGPEPAVPPAPAPDPQLGSGPADGAKTGGGSPTRPPEGKANEPEHAPPKPPPGEQKRAAKAILGADATASGTQLVVSFRESGVGPHAVTVIARADATATYGCISSNGNRQKARREASVEGVSQAASQFSAADGSAACALTLTPPAPAGISCPSEEGPVLLRVLYSRVTVLDTTTGASTTLNGTFPASG